MKAGIFQTSKGNLLYVAKDRSIKATTLDPSIVGQQVTTFNRGESIVFESGMSNADVQAKRVAAVPNGCTDHAKALADYQVSDAYQPPEGVLERKPHGEGGLVSYPAVHGERPETLRSDIQGEGGQGEGGNPDDVPAFDGQGPLDAYVKDKSVKVLSINVDGSTSRAQAKRIADASASLPTFSLEMDPVAAQALFGHRETEKPRFGHTATQMLQQEETARRWIILHEQHLQVLEKQGVIERFQDEIVVRDGDAYQRYFDEQLANKNDPDSEALRKMVGMDFSQAEAAVLAHREKHPDVYETMAKSIGLGEKNTASFDLEKRFHAGGLVSPRLLDGEVAVPLSMPRETIMPPAFGMPYGAEAQQAVLEKYRKVMIAGGWRPVHRQSARKHRRKGHIVREAFGRTWWRPRA